MIADSASILRITYEAFSKFSNSLTRCRSFREVESCFTIHLKYLFNCHVFRAGYEHNGVFVHLESAGRNTIINVQHEPGYLAHEDRILNSMVPLRITDVTTLNLPPNYYIKPDLSPELWAWNFINEDRHIVISLLASQAKRFSEKDVTFLRLVSESLEAKLLELCLIKELDEKNNEITTINGHQKEVIKERTKEIEEKNKALLEISILNAHSVREPLSRILGLTALLEHGGHVMMQTIAPMLKQSAQDLDGALQCVINHATKDLTALKA